MHAQNKTKPRSLAYMVRILNRPRSRRSSHQPNRFVVENVLAKEASRPRFFYFLHEEPFIPTTCDAVGKVRDPCGFIFRIGASRGATKVGERRRPPPLQQKTQKLPTETFEKFPLQATRYMGRWGFEASSRNGLVVTKTTTKDQNPIAMSGTRIARSPSPARFQKHRRIAKFFPLRQSKKSHRTETLLIIAENKRKIETKIETKKVAVARQHLR